MVLIGVDDGGAGRQKAGGEGEGREHKEKA